ncbi:MAG: hypothetical protein MHM6MM_004704 [Cercozoa sp. M6MM]
MKYEAALREIRALEERVSDLASLCDSRKTRVAEVEAKLLEAEKRCEDVLKQKQADAKRFEKDALAVSERLELLKRKFEAGEQRRSIEVGKQQEVFEQKLQEKSDAVARLTTRLHSLVDEKVQLRESLARKNAELEESQATLQKLEAERVGDEAKQQQKQAKKELALLELRTTAETLREELQSTRTHIATMVGWFERKHGAEHQKQQHLREQLQQREQALSEMKQRAEQLERAWAKSQQRSESTALKESIQQLQANLQVKEELVSTLQDQLTDVRNKLLRVETERNQLRQRSHTAESQAKQEAETQSHNAESEDSISTTHIVDGSYNAMKRERAVLRQELCDLSRRKKQSEREWQQRLAAVMEQLKRTAAQRDEFRNALRKEQTRGREFCRDFEKAAEALRRENAQLRDQLSILNVETKQQQSSIDRLARDNEHMRLRNMNSPQPRSTPQGPRLSQTSTVPLPQADHDEHQLKSSPVTKACVSMTVRRKERCGSTFPGELRSASKKPLSFEEQLESEPGIAD